MGDIVLGKHFVKNFLHHLAWVVSIVVYGSWEECVVLIVDLEDEHFAIATGRWSVDIDILARRHG